MEPKSIHVCKVRNAAVGLAGNGYSFALLMNQNEFRAQVAVLDAFFVPRKEVETVQLNMLWNVKASIEQRPSVPASYQRPM